jgi:hypothetical protein
MSNLAVFSAERIVTHIVPEGTVIKPGRYLPYVETEPPTYNPATEQLVAVNPIGTAVDPEATEVLQQWEVVARPPHTVRKDTILMRILAAGKVAEAMQVVENLTPENKFLFNNFDSFSSNNELVRGFITQIGLDPDVVLAAE